LINLTKSIFTIRKKKWEHNSENQQAKGKLKEKTKNPSTYHNKKKILDKIPHNRGIFRIAHHNKIPIKELLYILRFPCSNKIAAKINRKAKYPVLRKGSRKSRSFNYFCSV
jgi:predicted methyltransferase